MTRPESASRRGNDDEARAELTRVLALYRELGDRASEAVVLEDLAALDSDDASGRDRWIVPGHRRRAVRSRFYAGGHVALG